MLLFSGGQRSQTGTQRHTHSAYAYLNAAVRPDAAAIRDMLTQWCSHYPLAHRTKLRTAFTSKRDRQHYGAFFELLLHEFFRQQKCYVDVVPTIVGLRKPPDFAIHHPVAGAFLLEATVATETSDRDHGARAREAPVYEALDRIVSPNFWLTVKVDGEPRTTPPTKRLIQELTAWLAKEDYDAACARMAAGQHDQLPHCSWEHEGWQLRFQAVPKGPNLRGRPDRRTVAMRTPRFAVRGLTAEALRAAIIEKATRYGRPSLPYVIAVGVPHRHVAHEMLLDAVFGQSGVLVSLDAIGNVRSTTPRRRGPAAWVWPEQPQNTRVSAVLVVHGADPWNFATGHVEVLHNPFATHPLPLLPRIATCRQGPEDHEGHHHGESLRTLLGLPHEWPPPFTPFALSL